MTATYVLTRAAEADLRAIVHYTRAQWGTAQVTGYLDELKRGIERLSKSEGAVRRLDHLHPDLTCARSGHHFIFCLLRQSEPALILAILHERMDLMARLTARLDRD